MELSSPKIRKFLLLSGRSPLILFLKRTCSEKVCHILSKKAFLIFSCFIAIGFSDISGKVYSEP